MHLTNYAINKSHEQYGKGDIENKGSKRFLSYVLTYIEQNESKANVWSKIKDLTLKTLIAVQPSLSHSYKAARHQSTTDSLCFQILGFDIMLDHKLKPWLLEVNHAPSLNTDSTFDHHLKYNLVKDTIKILGLTISKKNSYKRKIQKELKQRILGKGNKHVESNLHIKSSDLTSEMSKEKHKIELGNYETLIIGDKYLSLMRNNIDENHNQGKVTKIIY